MIQHYHICMFWLHDDRARGKAFMQHSFEQTMTNVIMMII